MGEVTDRLSGLIFSADELRSITDWDERVVEDYLDLVRNIRIVAGFADDDNAQVAINTANIAINAANILTNSGNISSNTAQIVINTTAIALNTAASHAALTLNADTTTQESLNLVGQELQVNPATTTTAGAATAVQILKLSGIESLAQVNVQSDWNAIVGDALILNKPAISPVDVYQIIWAEENSGLSNGSNEWSFGNGSTGLIGIYSTFSGSIKKAFIQSETVGTSVSINIMINKVSAGVASFVANGIYTFPVAIPVAEGDEIGFQTNTVVGAWQDCRVGVGLVQDLVGLKGDTGSGSNVTLQDNNAPVGLFDILNFGSLLDVVDNGGGKSTVTVDESGINHASILNIGTNSHAQIDAHISDGTIHFTIGSISHLSIQDVGANTHAQIDNHIADILNPHSVTFTQAVTADAGTDITASEAETLSDGSNADLLHNHLLITDQTNNTASIFTGTFLVTLGGIVRMAIDAVGNLIASAYPQDTRDDGTVKGEKVLTTDVNGNILLRRVLPYSESIVNVVGGCSNTSALSLFMTLNFTIVEAGDYLIDYAWIWSLNTGSQDFILEVNLDAGDVLTYQQQRPRDTAGAGIALPNLDGGGTINTGTNQRQPASGFTKRTLTAGAHSITMSIGSSNSNNEAAIYQGSMKVTRDA